MNETGRIMRNAAAIGLVFSALIAFRASAADYTTDGRLIVGFGGVCIKSIGVVSNPVRCNPNDPSSYGALWMGSIKREPEKYALWVPASLSFVAADDTSRFLTPAGKTMDDYRRLLAREESGRNIRRASDVGATVTQK